VRAAIPQGVLAVGVFRGASKDELLRSIKELRLDAVQIDGAAPRGLGVPVLKILEPKRTDADRARAASRP